MSSVIGKTLKNEEIVLGDTPKYFVNCTLVNCKIIYPGGDSPFVNTKLDNCEIMFIGEAQKTLQFMQSIGMLTPVPQPPPAMAQMPEPGGVH